MEPENTQKNTMARRRENAKANEDKDVEMIISMINDPSSKSGDIFRLQHIIDLGEPIISSRRSYTNIKGKKAGDRSTHHDFQSESEQGIFNVEHKGTKQFAPIDPSLPPWKGGVQFHNGGMEKYRFAKKYAEAWYNMFIGSGVLKERYGLSAPIPSLEDWIKKDAKVQGNPGTEFGKELKRKYRELHPGRSLSAERNEFVSDFITKCTDEDCEMLKEDILPVLKASLADKHRWLQTAGDIQSGIFHCRWSRQLYVNEIKKIEIVKQSDIWINIECDNDFKFRAILRFGKGSGFSNIRIDLRD